MVVFVLGYALDKLTFQETFHILLGIVGFINVWPVGPPTYGRLRFLNNRRYVYVRKYVRNVYKLGNQLDFYFLFALSSFPSFASHRNM